MKHEIYQLVALTKSGQEYIIELNNANKNNKADLAFIDSGTSRFLDQQKLIDYLYKNGKVPNKEMTFRIGYIRNGKKRYMPLIYANNEIAYITKNIENTEKYNDFVFAFLKRIETELFSSDFYYYVKSLNEHYYSDKTSGNYLNDKTMGLLTEYFYIYVKFHNIDANKSNIQYDLLKQLYNYKTLRTLYTYHNEYLYNNQNQKQDCTNKVKKKEIR